MPPPPPAAAMNKQAPRSVKPTGNRKTGMYFIYQYLFFITLRPFSFLFFKKLKLLTNINNIFTGPPPSPPKATAAAIKKMMAGPPPPPPGISKSGTYFIYQYLFFITASFLFF
jgi:hypothetical protein